MSNPNWHWYSLGPNISLHVQLDENGMCNGNATGTLSLDLGNDRTVKIKSPYLLSGNLWSHIQWMTEDPELDGIDADVNSFFWTDNKNTKDITFIMHNSVSGVEMSFPVKRDEFDAGLVEILHDFLVHIPYTHPDDRSNIEWIDGDEPDFDEEPTFDEGPSRRVVAAFDVILEDAGPDKIKTLKVLRELTGLRLGEIKALITGLPKIVREETSNGDALWYRDRLEEVGAKIAIEPRKVIIESLEYNNTSCQASSCTVIEYINGDEPELDEEP